MSSDEEADNFETVTVPPETSNEDPPVYVIPQSQNIYQSQITKRNTYLQCVHMLLGITYPIKQKLIYFN